jgi:hypothetical protein
VVVGNKIVVFGGRTGGKVEADVKPTEVFDGKSWHDAASIPLPGDHLGAVTDGTYAYAIGGRNLKSSANNNHLQRFDPVTGQWTQLTPLPVANSDMGAVYVDGQIVTFGGENAFSVFNTVRSYNLATKAWSTLPNMAQARHGMGAAVVGTSIYDIDGASRRAIADPPARCGFSAAVLCHAAAITTAGPVRGGHATGRTMAATPWRTTTRWTRGSAAWPTWRRWPAICASAASRCASTWFSTTPRASTNGHARPSPGSRPTARCT